MPDPAAPSRSPRADQRRRLERLRATLARLEPAVPPASGIMPLGLEALDQALPGGGLRRGALHELHGAPRQGAAAGFATVLLARLMAAGGHAVWIGPRSDLYAPGLTALGLAAERLIVVRAGRREAGLWALEEALRSPGLAAALAEVERLDLTASRRLQLAAEAGGVCALLLRPPLAAGTAPGTSAAVTRWRIDALPGATAGGRTLGPPAWRVELFRCRGGRTGVWHIGWQREGLHEIADPVVVAADPADRPAAAAGGAPARDRRG